MKWLDVVQGGKNTTDSNKVENNVLCGAGSTYPTSVMFFFDAHKKTSENKTCLFPHYSLFFGTK